MRRRARGGCQAALLLLGLTVLGCAGERTGTLTGKVGLAGKPLPGGQVMVHGEGGKTAAGAIADGAYTIPNAPVGPVKVSVRTFAPSPKVVNPTDPNAGKDTGPPPAYVKIPDKYSDPDKSGLTTTVTGGSQTFDIDLKP